MSAGTHNAPSNGISSPTVNDDVPKATVNLRKTESMHTLPDISAATLAQDMRELSAWFRAQDGREAPQSLTPSNPSSPDERGISPAGPVNHRAFVAQRHASLSSASFLTSLDSDVETDSSLTSLDSNSGDDSRVSPASVRRDSPDDISQTTSMSLSEATRKRKRLALGRQPVRHSMRLRAKRRKVSSS